MDLIEFRKRYQVELKKGNVCREVHLNPGDAKKLLAQHTEWLRSKDTTELCGMRVIPNDSLPAGEVVFISWQPMQEKRNSSKIQRVEGIPKFRAWLKEPGIMQYSDKLSSFFKDYENTNVPIMQFTGLHDCKRKEIFEGDIIRREMCSPDDPAYGQYGMIGNVGFEMGCFIVDWEDGPNEYLGEVEESIIEVIGNIHQNL